MKRGGERRGKTPKNMVEPPRAPVSPYRNRSYYLGHRPLGTRCCTNSTTLIRCGTTRRVLLTFELMEKNLIIREMVFRLERFIYNRIRSESFSMVRHEFLLQAQSSSRLKAIET